MLDDDGSLLPGLLPGRYRGITFHVPNTSIDAGRRVVEYLFPAWILRPMTISGGCLVWSISPD